MGSNEEGEYVDSSQAEANIRQFLLSDKPGVTQNYRLKEYTAYRSLKISHSRLPRAGRGLFLSRPVKAGELLLISLAQVSYLRAFPITSTGRVSVPGPPDSSPGSSTSSANPQQRQSNEKRIDPEVHDYLAERLKGLLQTMAGKRAKKLKRSRKLKIFNLDHHTCDPTTLMNDIEGFRHQQLTAEIIASVTHCPCVSGNRNEMVRNIVVKNASFDELRCCVKDKPESAKAAEFWGVWVLPSLINHSCSPNCTRSRVGEALIIRAAKDLAAEEELTLPYFDVFKPLESRRQSSHLWDFNCECPRCVYEGSVDYSFGREVHVLHEQLQSLRDGGSLAARQKKAEAAFFLLDQLRSLCGDITELNNLVTLINSGPSDEDYSKEMESLRLNISKREKLRIIWRQKGVVGESSHFENKDLVCESVHSGNSGSQDLVGMPRHLLKLPPNCDARVRLDKGMVESLGKLKEMMVTDIQTSTGYLEIGADLRNRWIQAAFLDTYEATYGLNSNHITSYAIIDSKISWIWMVMAIRILGELVLIILSTDRGAVHGKMYVHRMLKLSDQCLSAEDSMFPTEWKRVISDYRRSLEKLQKMILTAYHGNLADDPELSEKVMRLMFV